MPSHRSRSYEEKKRLWLIQKKQEKRHEERKKAHIAKYERERMNQNRKTGGSTSRRSSRSRERDERPDPPSPEDQSPPQQIVLTLDYREIAPITRVLSAVQDAGRRVRHEDPTLPTRGGNQPSRTTEGESSLSNNEQRRPDNRRITGPQASTSGAQQDPHLPHRHHDDSRRSDRPRVEDNRHHDDSRRSDRPRVEDNRHRDDSRRSDRPRVDDDRREHTCHRSLSTRPPQPSPSADHYHRPEPEQHPRRSNSSRERDRSRRREQEHERRPHRPRSSSDSSRRHDHEPPSRRYIPRSHSPERNRCPICDTTNRNCLCCSRCNRQRNRCICYPIFCPLCLRRHNSGPCPRPQGHHPPNPPVERQLDAGWRPERPQAVPPHIGAIPDWNYPIHNPGLIPYHPVYYEPRHRFIAPRPPMWMQGQVPLQPPPPRYGPRRGARPHYPRQF